jgi:hypothetical protein
MDKRSAPRPPTSRCCYCRGPASGDYSIHSDDFGVGPEVPLCNGCAEDPAITCEMIWERCARPGQPDLRLIKGGA